MMEGEEWSETPLRFRNTVTHSSPHAGDCKRTPGHLPGQALIADTDRGPQGKGRLMYVCGLRRLISPIEEVRRARDGPGARE